MKVTEEDVRSALQTIVRHQEEKAVNWAVNYAKAGIHMSGEILRVQCLYVLNNITHWRGEDAKRVRNTLKSFTR